MMTNKQDKDIDSDLLGAIAQGDITYKADTAGAVVVALLEEAGRRHAAAVVQANHAQQAFNRAKADALRADADREAAAKLLTSLHRAGLAGEHESTPSKP